MPTYTTAFEDENELTEWVRKHYKTFFDDSSVWIPKQFGLYPSATRKRTWARPDGFVIDFESQQWAIIECELQMHGIWRPEQRSGRIRPGHIVEQIVAFAAALHNRRTLNELRSKIYSYLRDEGVHHEMMPYYECNEREHYLNVRLRSILFRATPTIAIFVDNCDVDSRFAREMSPFIKALSANIQVFGVNKPEHGAIRPAHDAKPIISNRHEMRPSSAGLDTLWLSEQNYLIGKDVHRMAAIKGNVWDAGTEVIQFFQCSFNRNVNAFVFQADESDLMCSSEDKSAEIVLLLGNDGWIQFESEEFREMLENVRGIDSRTRKIDVNVTGGQRLYAEKHSLGHDVSSHHGCW